MKLLVRLEGQCHRVMVVVCMVFPVVAVRDGGFDDDRFFVSGVCPDHLACVLFLARQFYVAVLTVSLSSNLSELVALISFLAKGYWWY